ncbi:MAG: carbohydrate porin [Planctomycetota bacterium]
MRSSLLENGINFRTNFTQFYQGVTSGGLEQKFNYAPKFDYFAIVEMEKLLGLKGMIVNLHGESRFGQTVNRLDGALLPSNFASQFPSGQGQASALTNMQIQQFLSENFVVSFGKINTADGMNIHPFMGGYGTDRFMNTAFILNPAYGLAIPYSTLGASFTYLRNFDPVATLLIVDPTGKPGTSGFNPMLSNGVSLLGQLRIPVRPADLPGHQTLEFVWSSGKFSPLSVNDYVLIPGQGLNAQKQTGTWLFNYGFDQFIVHDATKPGKGWGIFGNFSVADQKTNPIAGYISLGVAGSRLIASRPDDSFGLGYFFLDVSNTFQRSIQPLLPTGNEQGMEFYYNANLTRWFQLTVDLQAMDTARSDAQSCLLFGLRGKIIF